mgnify:CR=1 FL=1
MLTKMRHAAFALALSLAPHPASAIVGESVDGAARAQQLVMVLTKGNKSGGFCSAVVITQHVLLTAGHCAAEPDDTVVFLRRANEADGFTPVASVAIHPLYRPQALQTREKTVDLALIRLKAPLPSFYAPARLSTRDTMAVGETFDLVGFGLTKENEGKTGGQLRVAKIATRQPLSKLLLWAEDPKQRGTGACTGDSGGGIFAPSSHELIATTVWSAGNGKTHCGSLTQGVLVSSQRDWIEQTLRKWGEALP